MHTVKLCSKEKGDHVKQEVNGEMVKLCTTDKCQVRTLCYNVPNRAIHLRVVDVFVEHVKNQERSKAFQLFNNQEMYEEFVKSYPEYEEITFFTTFRRLKPWWIKFAIQE